MKQKAPVSPKIPEIFTMSMRFVSLPEGLGQGHGLSRFPCDTYIIEMNRMVKLVLEGHNDDRIAGHLFIDGYIDAQKKSYQQETDQQDDNDFRSFSHRLPFPLKRGPLPAFPLAFPLGFDFSDLL